MLLKPVTPRGLLLDLLRVTDAKAVPVSVLVQIGNVFGLTGNALRVAIARLVAAKLVESDERGFYRLAKGADALAVHVEEWRLGERRVRPWQGEWLALCLPQATERVRRRASLRALGHMGFREALTSFWVRPDNLATRTHAETLFALGLENGAEAFVVRELSTELESRLRTRTWNTRELVNGYREMRQKLEQSERSIAARSAELALRESFQLGGSAIRLLATDPLLPEEIVPSVERARLTAAMLRYDAVGRKVWAQALEGIRLQAAPSHSTHAEVFA